MFCSKCTYRQSVGDKFCAHCGFSFAGKLGTEGDRAIAPESPSHPPKQYNKIGGWLGLLAVLVFLDPIVNSYAVFDSLSSIINDPNLLPGLVNLLWFEVMLGIICFFLTVYSVISFYQKKTIFPKYYIWLLVISILYMIVRYVLLISLSSPLGEGQETLDIMIDDQLFLMVVGIISNTALIVYLKVSKRVKGTFIN